MKNLMFCFLSSLALLLITIGLHNTVDGWRRRRSCTPSDCEVSAWSSWSNCSLPCGTGGTQNRTRTVTKEKSCGGSCKYELTQNRSCNNNETDCHLQGRPQGEDYCACDAGYTGNCCEMKCGGDVRGKSGRIHYEGWPGTEVGKCIWQAHTNEYSTVSAKMDTCSLQVSSYIEIRDGVENDAPLLKNITQSDCIAGLIHVGYTSSNKMWVRLISSAQLEQNIYFDLTFHECGGAVEGGSGKIQSPFYPESYVKDGNCSWEIQAPYATVISSTFNNFTLRYSEDFVQMGNVIGVPDIGLYGNNATPVENVTDTKGNKLWVSSVALDLIDSDGIEPCGFEMEFQSKLVATEEYVTSYNGSVFSPMYPFPYPTNITYTTKISTPEGTVVTLGFTELQLRRGDNVSVYDDGAKLVLAYVHGDDPGMETVIVRSNVSYVVLYSGIGDNTTNGSYSLGFEALRVCLATDNEGNGDIYPEEDYYLPGEVVTVVCHIGFESSTNYTNITCEEGGRWDTEMPVCAIVVCGDPGQPDNGVRIGDEFSYGDTVAYQCNEGYTLNGTNAITCQSTGTWDGEAPTCQIVSCGDPGEVENGDAVGDDFTYGKNITYHCHEGYTVNGTETITCQSNGQWSDSVPVCALVTEIGDTSLTAVTVTVSMALFVMIILIVIAAIVLYRRSISAKPKTSEVNDLPNVTYELTTSGMNGAEQMKGSTTLNNTKNNQRVKTSNYIHTYENAGLEVHDDLRKSKCLGNINIIESSTDDIYNGIDESDGDLNIGSGFVHNDIYEAGDDKTVDSVMNIKRSGLGNGQNDDPNSDRKNCLSGVKKNVAYQNVDGSFEEYDEEAYVIKDMHPLGESGKSENGDVDARCTVTDGQAKPRQNGGKPDGAGGVSDPVSSNSIENGEYDHMYSDIGPDGDITETRRLPMNAFTENIAYEANDDVTGTEGQPRANVSVAGFVDNEIYESGEHEVNPKPDSNFTENVLYQPSGDESQDLSVDDVDQDVYYSTIGDGDHQSGFQDNIAYESTNSPK